jgi:hypothetical protein
MTRKRAQTSIAPDTLYPSTRSRKDAIPIGGNVVPVTPPRVRTTSGMSNSSVNTIEEGEKVISFREVAVGGRGKLWEGLKKSLGG